MGGEAVNIEFGRGEPRLRDVRAGVQEMGWRGLGGGSEAVKRKRRAELSSLQSSLNCTNRICYCCNGRHKEKQKMRRGFLEVVRSVCVCVCVPKADKSEASLICLQQRIHVLLISPLSQGQNRLFIFPFTLVTTSCRLKTSLSSHLHTKKKKMAYYVCARRGEQV